MDPRIIEPVSGYIKPNELHLVEVRPVHVGGVYKVLNLSSYKIDPGTLYALDGSVAHLAILGGAVVPAGIYLENLRVEGRVHASCVLASNFVLGYASGDVDVSASKIDGMFELNRMENGVSLMMSDGIFGTVGLGKNPNLELHILDVRGTTISEVKKPWPAKIDEVWSEVATLPEDFEAYLKKMEKQ